MPQAEEHIDNFLRVKLVKSMPDKPGHGKDVHHLTANPERPNRISQHLFDVEAMLCSS